MTPPRRDSSKGRGDSLNDTVNNESKGRTVDMAKEMAPTVDATERLSDGKEGRVTESSVSTQRATASAVESTKSDHLREKEKAIELAASSPTSRMDLGRLRLPQNFAGLTPVKREIVTVPIRKPDKHEWVRVHTTHRFETALLENKQDREIFAVDQDLWSSLQAELVPKILFLSVSKQGNLFLWPIRLPGEDGRIDHWNESAMRAATLAQSKWIRVMANMSAGYYDVRTPVADLGPAEWPENVSFDALVEIAFKGRVISSSDHPVLRRLRGEV